MRLIIALLLALLLSPNGLLAQDPSSAEAELIFGEPAPQTFDVFAGNADESTKNRGIIGGGGYYYAVVTIAPRYEYPGDGTVRIILDQNRVTRVEKARQDPSGLAVLVWSFDIMDMDSPAQLVRSVTARFNDGEATSELQSSGVYVFDLPSTSSRLERFDVGWSWLGNDHTLTFDADGGGYAGWFLPLLLAAMALFGFVYNRRKKDRADTKESEEEDEAKRTMRSTFALREFTNVARSLKVTDFSAWITLIFDTDIPPEATRSIRQALLTGTFPNPEIELRPAVGAGGHVAAYDQASHRILIADALVDAARASNDGAARLLAALVEEFGHHVDFMLRNVYSRTGGDARLDEGAAFAHAIVLFDVEHTARVTYAILVEDETTTPLELDLAHMHQQDERLLADREILADERSGDLEFFGAGEPKDPEGTSSTHKTIEKAAFEALNRRLNGGVPRLDDDEVSRAYFGNWLRDYSQLVDPKVCYHEELNPWGLSRDTLTKIVDVLAQDAFGPDDDFTVTMERLGVYRPEEHVDNPRGYADASGVDADFRGACTDAEIMVDSRTGMKSYIRTSGAWPTAAGYIEREIRAAMDEGRTTAGLRRLGNALHTLEDFYAHSNFVELALRKAGFANVHPWVAVPANGPAPLVTGSFGGLDTAASILIEIGERLQKDETFDEWLKDGKLSRLLLIILQEKYPRAARVYEVGGTISDMLMPESIRRIQYETLQQLKSLALYGIGAVLLAVTDEIEAAQDQTSADDPTHTQLAKDHYFHPYHALAASLAQRAAEDVVEKTARFWSGEKTDPVAAAHAYLVHPKDSTALDRIVKDWGTDNERALREGNDPDGTNRQIRAHIEEMRRQARQWTNGLDPDAMQERVDQGIRRVDDRLNDLKEKLKENLPQLPDWLRPG